MTMPDLAHVATWSIAAQAVSGVIVRPWRVPEAVWAGVGAMVLVIFGLLRHEYDRLLAKPISVLTCGCAARNRKLRADLKSSLRANQGQTIMRWLLVTRDNDMPEKETQRRAADDKRKGKSASTQAGEYVHEEIEHVREGKHGARSTKQAIAIGLSKARRAGVKVPAPTGNASESTRKKAHQDADAAKQHKAPSRKRSRAVSEVLKHEGHSSVLKKALSAHAKTAAKKRPASDRSAAARTKGDAGRSAAAKKATRAREAHQ